MVKGGQLLVSPPTIENKIEKFYFLISSAIKRKIIIIIIITFFSTLGSKPTLGSKVNEGKKH